MTNEAIYNFASAMMMNETNPKILNFLDQVQLLTQIDSARGDNNGRPIPAAADQVKETARAAAVMLAELRAGWLWQYLIKQPKPQ